MSKQPRIIILFVFLIVAGLMPMAVTVHADQPFCESLSLYSHAEKVSHVSFQSFTILANYSNFEKGIDNHTVYYVDGTNSSYVESRDYGELYYYEGNVAFIYECLVPPSTNENIAYTTSTTTNTSIALPIGIPAFPAESIIIGLLFGVTVLFLIRKRRNTRPHKNTGVAE